MENDAPTPQNTGAEIQTVDPGIDFLDPALWNDWENIIAGCLGILILGIILGLTKKITVFENYNDLFMTFVASIIPSTMLYFSFMTGIPIDGPIALIGWAISAASFIYIVIRTYASNNGIFSALLALITKIPLGFFFVLTVIDFVVPVGKTMSDRANMRRTGFISLLLLTPLIYNLIKTHDGFINLKKFTGRVGN